MKTSLRAVVCALGVSGIVASAGADVIFNDGGTHDIGSDQGAGNNVIVQDGPGNSTTTVNLVSGGIIQEGFDAFDTSVITMSDGSVGTTLEVNDDATGTITGGSIGDGVVVNDNGTLVIEGGTIGSQDSFFNDDAELLMSGGDGEGFVFNDNATGEVTGGSLEAVFTNDDAVVTVVDIDLLFDAVGARDRSNIQIFRGLLTIEDMFSRGTAVIDIYGTSFNRPFGEIADLSGELSGTLLDGTAFNAFDFVRDDTAKIILHGPPVPEPPTLAVLALALAGLAARRRRAGVGQASS